MAAGSMLLLLHLIWRVNIKQAYLIDRADWREEKRQAYKGEALRGKRGGEKDGHGLARGRKTEAKCGKMFIQTKYSI